MRIVKLSSSEQELLRLGSRINSLLNSFTDLLYPKLPPAGLDQKLDTTRFDLVTHSLSLVNVPKAVLGYVDLGNFKPYWRTGRLFTDDMIVGLHPYLDENSEDLLAKLQEADELVWSIRHRVRITRL